jgi:very-short-patch-repair endonuclease
MPTGVYKRTKEQIEQCIHNCEKYGRATRFKKGVIPKYHWKKGHIPWNRGKYYKLKLEKSPYRVCLICNSEYIPTGSRQIYCSNCRYIEVSCHICGKKFLKRRTFVEFHLREHPDYKWFCSRNCVSAHQTNSEVRICEQCGTSFKCWRSSSRKFCSRKCYDLHQNTQEIRICGWCGNEYKVCHNSDQFYCSKKCGLARSGETSIERIMRIELEKRNISYKQYEKIGTFFVDFLLDNNVVIECDGIHWHTKPEVAERDIRKNEYLAKEDYKVYRFSDKEINEDVSKCVDIVQGGL